MKNNLDNRYGIITVTDEERILPTLQIVTFLKKDYLVGKCLDFNFICYSKIENGVNPIEIIVRQMCDLSIDNLKKHLERGTIDYIYENAIKTGNDDWEFYLLKQRKKRINIIKELFLHKIQRISDTSIKTLRLYSGYSGYIEEKLESA